jgi:hypothetical protein
MLSPAARPDVAAEIGANNRAEWPTQCNPYYSLQTDTLSCAKHRASHHMPKYLDAPKQRITKIDAAERQLVTAIDLFFRNGDALAVYALAGAAREVVTAMCEARQVESLFKDILLATGLTEKELRDMANRYRNFFKHADRDPDAVLTEFSDEDNDPILFVAGHDFARLVKGMPVEMQVYEAWYLSCNEEKIALSKRDEFLNLFPGISGLPRYERKHRGLIALDWARSEPTFKMNYSTE